MTENEFQTMVIDCAKLNGWQVAHFRGVRTQRHDGSVFYQTPVQADGKGFPDLVMIRERILIVELKAEKGRTTSEQEVWLQLFDDVLPPNSVFVWKPSQFDEIVKILAR